MRYLMILAVAGLAIGCGTIPQTTTNNYITFEKDSLSIMEGLAKANVDAGMLADGASGGGAGDNANASGGGSERSPGGGMNAVRGFGNATIIIVTSGETPSGPVTGATTTTDASAELPVGP